MRLITTLLIAAALICNYSYAATSPEINKLLNHAKQSYKNKNYSEAISSYEKAIKLGSPKARLYLSSMYERGIGVEKNKNIAKEYVDEAIEIYKNLAKNNDADAQYELGGIYTYRIKPARNLEAYNWFLMAAKNNHMKAQYMVASILDTGSGEPEVQRNIKEAIKWYEKSASQGNFRAAFKAALYNSNDFEYVMKWCGPPAEQGYKKCIEVINTSRFKTGN